MRGLVLVLAGLALVAPPAAAQVELDGTLRPLPDTGALVPSGTLPDGSTATYLIDESYGVRSDRNLFHSFGRFDIPVNQSAAFTGDAAIERVIARVTGTSGSLIDGTLRNTIEGADLYLLNPRGIFFSRTASLDLRGSLYLSTADNLRFADDLVYSANPISTGVLSFEAPSAWGFTSTSAPGPIRFTQARNLAVPRGETLEVVGGQINVSGFVPTTTLSAPGGTIALASRALPGEVPVDVAQLAARDAATTELGSISLGANAVLDVSDPTNLAAARGRIVIRSGALTLDASVLRADSAVDAAPDTPDVDVETTRSILLRRTNPLFQATTIESRARGSADGGGVRLESETITLSGGSIARTTATDSARAGSLEVTAGSVQLSGQSGFTTSADDNATTGPLAVSAPAIGLSESSIVGSTNEATTDALEVRISGGALTVNSGAKVLSQSDGAGRGAQVHVEMASVDVGAARIESDSFGTGAGGDLEIDADRVTLTGDPLSSVAGGVFAGSFASGDAGGIDITTDELTVSGSGQISATTEGSGRGGDIEIHASREVELSGSGAAGPSGVFARSGAAQIVTNTGEGGSILIEASLVAVRDGAEISAQTFGPGAGGDVRVLASDSIVVSSGATARSGINAKAAEGEGGNVEIETAELRVEDGGEISASTLDTGGSGDIEITSQRVFVGGGELSPAGPAGIFAQSIPSANSGVIGGDGGDIAIRAESIVEVSHSGVISVKTRGIGKAGSILIVAPVVNVIDGAEVSALSESQAEGGAAGAVRLDGVGALLVRDGGRITTETQGAGTGGDIELHSVREVVVGDGGEISASTRRGGEAGEVTLTDVGDLFVVDGGRISSQTSGAGAGGSISIGVLRQVVVDDGGEISARTDGSGNAGAVSITGADLVEIQGGEISARSANTEGAGAAGAVTITDVGELLVVAGGSISTETLGDGAGGSIAIDAQRQVLLTSGGTISARSAGTSDAGSIAIDAGRNFTARGGGEVTTSAQAADGGNIEIGATNMIYVLDGAITTDVRAGEGSGGNIALDPEFVVLNHADVIARAIGDGGNITIETSYFVRDAASVVDASSQLGIDGEIQITSPAVDLSSELAQLDATFLDASSELAAACAARAGERGTFAVRGRARAASPDAPLGSPDDGARAPACDARKP